jgi:hypothetical protein
MHEEQELPQPSFRLTWRDGTYRVSRPNVGETDCYTADQMREYGRQCASLAKPQPVGGALTNEQAQIFAHAIYNVSRGDFEATVDEAKAVYRAALATLSAPAAQPGEAVSDEAEAFEQLCREHDIFGTAAARQCEVFWRAGAAFLAPSHSDDSAVDRFACAMKAKMAKQRAKGYHGWDNPSECTVEDLSRMLIEHVPKGDPVDVANFAMMLHQRGSGITPLATPIAAQPAAAAPAVPDADEITRLRRGWNVEASDLDALLRLLGLTPADHRTEGGNLRLEKVRAALSQAAAVPEAVERDAARYRLLRRGQQWSVIDGIGDALRGGVLDAAIDRLAAGGQGDVSGEGEGS